MSKIELNIQNCPSSCNHFGYCQIYWGSECKRQGGTKIPRMRFMRQEERQIIEKKKRKKREGFKINMLETFEPIRTKANKW